MHRYEDASKVNHKSVVAFSGMTVYKDFLARAVLLLFMTRDESYAGKVALI